MDAWFLYVEYVVFDFFNLGFVDDSCERHLVALQYGRVRNAYVFESCVVSSEVKGPGDARSIFGFFDVPVQELLLQFRLKRAVAGLLRDVSV